LLLLLLMLGYRPSSSDTNKLSQQQAADRPLHGSRQSALPSRAEP